MKFQFLIMYNNENQFAAFLQNNELCKHHFRVVRSHRDICGLDREQTLYLLPDCETNRERIYTVADWRGRGGNTKDISEEVVLGSERFLV